MNCYDHKHCRVRKIVERFENDSWQVAETHAFVYDGSNIVLERVALADGSTKTIEYYWGNDLSSSEHGAGGVGGLLAVSVDGVYYFPCYDQNGNVVCYVSESGTIAAQYVFDPYGNVIDQYGTLADAFAIRFSTKYTDPETGLISYLRRFYRPDHGRWLNRDPIFEVGGENLYAFCLNSPILYVDVDGKVLLVDSLVLTAVGGIIGGVSAALSGGDVVAGVVGGAVSGLCISICPGAAAGCGAMGGAVSGFISGIRSANRNKLCGARWHVHVIGSVVIETTSGALFGKVGGALGDGMQAAMGSWTKTITTSSLSLSIDVVGTDFATSLSCGVSSTAAETVMDAIEGAVDAVSNMGEVQDYNMEQVNVELDASGTFQ